MGDEQKVFDICKGLNNNQRMAVASPRIGQLQVIAGPGTGKTKVLTSRVAYLILKHQLDPSTIIVTTFTKKAANEMTERLHKMLAGCDVDLSKLMIGTFHHICSRLLRKFGYLIKLERGFKVATERDTESIMKDLVKKLEKELEPILLAPREYETVLQLSSNPSKKTFEPKKILSLISGLKAEGIFIADYIKDPKQNRPLLRFYEEYEKKLKIIKSLDFDDLLLYANKLLLNHKCYKHLQHLLVDEFQDTNNIQLQLIRSFGLQSYSNPNNITIVGDPDQSIYSFRAAVANNFEIFEKQYPETRKVYLNENYRSTKEVLDISELFMRQQQGRKPRELNSNSELNFKPVYLKCVDSQIEAERIAQEIKTLMSLPGLFKYSDFVILLRAAYLSRVIEKAFVKYRIAYSVVKGRAFWTRKEVCLVVDFLRMFAYDDDIPAITRVLGECTSGIGEKGLSVLTEFLEEKLQEKVLPIDALVGLIRGEYKLETTVKNLSNIESFLTIVDSLYGIYNKGPADKEVVIEFFDKVIKLEVFNKLAKNNEDVQGNLLETRNFLNDFVPEEEEILYDYYSEEETEYPKEEVTEEDRKDSFLDLFIRSVDLYLVADDKKSEDGKGAVSISTVHAAKGLEWPVVFVPCLIEGVLPSLKESHIDSINEERRIFYVATTRAKYLLYLCYGSRFPENTESSFLTPEIKRSTAKLQTAFNDTNSLELLYKCTDVTPPSQDKLQHFVNVYREILKMRRAVPTEEDNPNEFNKENSFKINRYVNNIGKTVFSDSYNLISSERKFAPNGIRIITDSNGQKKRKTLGMRRRIPSK